MILQVVKLGKLLLQIIIRIFRSSLSVKIIKSRNPSLSAKTKNFYERTNLFIEFELLAEKIIMGLSIKY